MKSLKKYNEKHERLNVKQFSESKKIIKTLGNSQDCKQCKHHLSDNGIFPFEPCIECSLFYSSKWESK